MPPELRPVRGHELDTLAERTDRRYHVLVRLLLALVVAMGLVVWMLEGRVSSADERRDQVVALWCGRSATLVGLESRVATVQARWADAIARAHSQDPAVVRAAREAQHLESEVAAERARFALDACRASEQSVTVPIATVEVAP